MADRATDGCDHRCQNAACLQSVDARFEKKITSGCRIVEAVAESRMVLVVIGTWRRWRWRKRKRKQSAKRRFEGLPTRLSLFLGGKLSSTRLKDQNCSFERLAVQGFAVSMTLQLNHAGRQQLVNYPTQSVRCFTADGLGGASSFIAF